MRKPVDPTSAKTEVALRKDSRENCLSLPLVVNLRSPKRVHNHFHAANNNKQKRISAALNHLQSLVNAQMPSPGTVSLLKLPPAITEQVTSEGHRGALIKLYTALGRPELFPKKPSGGTPDTSLPAIFSEPRITPSLAKLEKKEGEKFMRRARSAMRTFAAYLQEHKEHNVHKLDVIKHDAADAFLASLHPDTAYHYRSLLRRVFEHLHDARIIPINPFLLVREQQDTKDKPIRHILWLCKNSGADFEKRLRDHIARYRTRHDPVDGFSIQASAINGFGTWLITKKIDNLHQLTVQHLLEYRMEFLPGCDGLEPVTQDNYFGQVTGMLRDLPFTRNPAELFRSGKTAQSIAAEVGFVARPSQQRKRAVHRLPPPGSSS